MATPNIRIDIASEFKDRGFKKAQQSSTVLDRQFKRLARTFITVFSIRAITNFGKASVRAFADAEREATQLRTALKALNLEFASPLLNQYVDSLELATGRAGDDLTNAFVTLSAATQDVTTAQSLLNTAMDISAATGKDLQTVSVALQRAYKGEVTALARLRIGLTTAELKGKDFDSVLGDLRDRFTGAQAAAADTYAGKIARLGQATEQAREKIGEGFVKGLNDAGVSVEQLQANLIALGSTAGKLSASFINLGTNIGGAFDGLLNNRGIQFILGAIDTMDRKLGFLPGQLQGVQILPNERRAKLAEAQRIEAIRDQVKAQNNLYKAEQKNRVAADRATKKAERERQALKRAGTVFDMENIQIVAAMQGEIDAQERLRLVALLALNTDNAEAAEATSRAVLSLNAAALASLGVTLKAGDNVDIVIKKLLQSQADLALVALGITNLPKAKNPFEDWDAIIKKILDDLVKIQAGLSFKLPEQKQQQQTQVVPPLTHPLLPGVDLNKLVLGGEGDYPSSVKGTGLTKGFETVAKASAGAVDLSFDTGDFFESLGRDVTQNGVNVTVNVAGSVTSEEDLTNTILDNLYRFQGFGRPISYNIATV